MICNEALNTSRHTIINIFLLYLDIWEDTTFHPLCARTTKLCIDLRRVNDGEDKHYNEHQQRIEDVQIGLMRDNIAIIA